MSCDNRFRPHFVEMAPGATTVGSGPGGRTRRCSASRRRGGATCKGLTATRTRPRRRWTSGSSSRGGRVRTSLTDLTGALGIGPASFYFAFGSKEALFRRVVDRYLAFQADAFERAFQAPSTAAGVEALLCGYVDVVTDPEHAPGCLVVNNAPSADAGDALRQWLVGHREALRVRLEEQFFEDLASGKLPDDFEPKAMARFIVTLAGGLAVEAGTGATREDLYDAVAFWPEDVSWLTGRADETEPP